MPPVGEEHPFITSMKWYQMTSMEGQRKEGLTFGAFMVIRKSSQLQRSQDPARMVSNLPFF